MFEVLSPTEFYEATLARQQLEMGDETAVIEKIAEKHGISFEQAKLAQLYYEQLGKDEALSGDTWYDSDEARQEDAFKLAQAYYDHVTTTEKTATAKADRLLEKLAAAAAEWAKDAGLEDFDPVELVKVAGLQAESALEFQDKVAELQEKSAALAAQFVAPEPADGEQKIANRVDPAQLHLGSELDPSTLRMPEWKRMHGAQLAAANPSLSHLHEGLASGNQDALKEIMAAADQHLSGMGYRTPEQQAALGVNVLKHHGENPNASYLDSFNAVHQGHLRDTTGMRGFVNRNKTPLAIGGVGAGLGALYLLHQHHQKKKRQAEIDRLRAEAAIPQGIPQGSPQPANPAQAVGA